MLENARIMYKGGERKQKMKPHYSILEIALGIWMIGN